MFEKANFSHSCRETTLGAERIQGQQEEKTKMTTLKQTATQFGVLVGLILFLFSTELPAQSLPNSVELPDAPVVSQSQINHQEQAGEPAKVEQRSNLPIGSAEPTSVTVPGTPKRMLLDEKLLLASPFRLRIDDARWLLPFAATTGVLIGTDAHSMTLEHINGNDENRASKLTDGTVGLLGALPAGMLLWSSVRYAPLARETGILTSEALGDALILGEAGKVIFRRERPAVGNGQGNFFSSSFGQASFPSSHATAAWAMAAVVGDEYPGWLPRTVVYALAAATSAGRVVSEKHFPSDVLVGSALGWLVGHYVYRAHHDYELSPYRDPPVQRNYSPTVVKSNAMNPPPVVGAQPEKAAPPQTTAAKSTTAATIAPAAGPPTAGMPTAALNLRQTLPRESFEDIGETDPDTVGSTNVPMDSWVYPALERLAAMGFIPSQNSAIRPWTRIECERQIAEASDLVAGTGPNERSYSESGMSEGERLLDALKREFDGRVAANESIALENVYARYGNIAGPALADSYHFGQTWWNDFGRPLGRGGSSLLGFSGHATEGRIFLYAREEVQQGPGAPPYSSAVEELIAKLDQNPIQSSAATSSYTRYRPIELYAGIAFEGNALSFGKQELFWGPTTMGPLMFSSNAEPTYSLRFVSTRPHPLPFFPNLGTYRFDIVLGKLSGHGVAGEVLANEPARPWYNAQKASFNFGQNLELSFTRWSILWGVGHGMSLHSLLRNLDNFSSGDLPGINPGTYPGSFDSGFDFRYRLPWLSKLVTLYADGYANDDPNPIDAPRRAMWNPGIYFARLPWLPHMDLRVEAVSSEQLARDLGGDYYYFKHYYHDESTHRGFLLGSAIGRDSRAEEARVGWWVSAQTRVEVGYRQNKGGHLSDPEKNGALPSGSTIGDGFVNARLQLSRQWSAQVFGQYERFLIPDYMAGAQSNKSAWLQLTWTPGMDWHR